MEPTVPPKVEVPERLKSKNDERKLAWWQKKIAVLEEELEAYRKGADSPTNSDSWAEGFVAAMHAFQIQNKSSRQRILQQLKVNGPGYAKKLKGAKFRGFTM